MTSRLSIFGLCVIVLFLSKQPLLGADGAYHTNANHFQNKGIRCNTCHISHRPQGPHLMKAKEGDACLSCHKKTDTIRWKTKAKFGKKDKARGPFDGHPNSKFSQEFLPPGKPFNGGKGFFPPGKGKEKEKGQEKKK